MSSKYNFFEVVKVKSERSALEEINGLEGVVLGMAENHQGNWNYSVHILETDECWDINEPELISTGKMMKREDFYDGDSVSVEVDQQSGEGKII